MCRCEVCTGGQDPLWHCVTLESLICVCHTAVFIRSGQQCRHAGCRYVEHRAARGCLFNEVWCQQPAGTAITGLSQLRTKCQCTVLYRCTLGGVVRPLATVALLVYLNVAPSCSTQFVIARLASMHTISHLLVRCVHTGILCLRRAFLCGLLSLYGRVGRTVWSVYGAAWLKRYMCHSSPSVDALNIDTLTSQCLFNSLGAAL